MNLIHGTSKACKFAPEDDAISSMPDNVVTNILDRLPLQDAVSTSILSRKWRFKWTMLSQLVFDEKFFEYLVETKGECYVASVINRLLLQLNGVISNFVLSTLEHCYKILDFKDINPWISFLSRKGVKELTLKTSRLHKLPTHFFSCSELKHLKLYNCRFDPPADFHGFPNLLSLKLDLVLSESSKLGEFISGCPLLEILNMRYTRSRYEIMRMDLNRKGQVKLVEITKLANLKILSLSLGYLDNTMIISSSTIIELLGSFTNLQEVDLDFVRCKLIEDGAKKEFPTAFPCLKVLKLSRTDFRNGVMLSCAFELIRRSPNVQILEITSAECDAIPAPIICSSEIDYNTMGTLQLEHVIFTYCKGLEAEVCLVKYLLARSPLLKRIVINTGPLCNEKKLMLTTKLLMLHRASTAAEIEFH